MDNIEQDDPTKNKPLHQGPLQFLRKRGFGRGKKFGQHYVILSEAFDALWQRSYTFQVFAKKGAKKPVTKLCIDENVAVELSENGFTLKGSGSTELTFKAATEDIAEWLGYFGQCGVPVPSNSPLQDPVLPPDPPQKVSHERGQVANSPERDDSQSTDSADVPAPAAVKQCGRTDNHSQNTGQDCY